MQLSSLFSAVLIAAATVSAAGLSAFGRQDQIRLTAGDFPIPGKNPLDYCNDPRDYLLNVTAVDLSPNPPKKGTKLTISGEGSLKADISEDAKVNIQVKYGVIRLINQELTLCDYASQADLKCPLKKGDVKVKKEVELPQQIPPGQYTVLANVFQGPDGDSEVITCFSAQITF